MSDPTEVTYYRGQPIEEMSRDELIEALKEMGKLYHDQIQTSLSQNRTWSNLMKLQREYARG
jgi:hypothetical protein